uniref:Uncharacterized protein n=1 Tax=Arundo donax TaxID=35708 RepID=A0A0A9FD44_ARUDO
MHRSLACSHQQEYSYLRKIIKALAMLFSVVQYLTHQPSEFSNIV